MTKNETMRLALDALSYAADEIWCENDDDIIADAVRALRTVLAQPDVQIGITYEEANPPQPHCERCGKKLGIKVTDIHTCTPKENNAVAWVDSLNGARPDCVTDFKYLSVAQIERKEHLQYIALYTAAQKKEWVGLTDEERIDCEIRAEHNWVLFADIIEAKLKDKNETT